MNLEIWTEKYRPKKLDEIVNQKSIVSRLSALPDLPALVKLLQPFVLLTSSSESSGDKII
jgi:hypothetical protein